ncbi:extracellular solute-binding protein [Kiloniella laminariae]|uniref:Extracellular solute-binding protein n=1 Tax=Kiloniella laminariae TaxID=454162 RepID=A0ABT4LGI3_9PROT|nr:extracellular solute-binding protein [Kiloniella laminariae]MCZ4280210.1 extracellular solute-binding protein [Kiloniella laminariae]
MKKNVFKNWSSALVLGGSVWAVVPAQAEEVVLNVVTAGAQNMLDYVTDYLGPKFEESHPGVKVRAVSTGAGSAGSQAIYEKLSAQKDQDSWDIDVAVVHQLKAGELVEEGLLARYKDEISTGKLATRDSSVNALGADVSGYVIPMFHSQTAIAYNPLLVKDAPSSYDELEAWAGEHPGQFGYNGIKNGMSGVSFVTGWIYNFAPEGEKIIAGYDAGTAQTWEPALARLKQFNENVTFTPGNAGTLDMLGRGEIAMGPVWVDMFYQWRDEGKLDPNTKLKLIGPGMPGQPMYYVVPKKAAHGDLAREFIELATSPTVQAEGIVSRFSWYPGIDAEHVKDDLDASVWNKLFVDVTPEDLATKGKAFPVAKHLDEIREAYEAQVSN